MATDMRTDMALDAVELARWSRATGLERLVAHSDAAANFTSIRYGEPLAEVGAVPSIGHVGFEAAFTVGSLPAGRWETN